MRWAERQVARIVLAAILAAGLLGCGVPLQDQAEPLPGGVLPTATPTPTASPQVQSGTMFFVSGRALVGVREPIPARTATGVMDALGQGPPVDQQSQLRSLLIDPLTQTPMLVVTSESGGTVTLQRSEAYPLMQATDQILLTGQVVLSLADVGFSEVVVTDSQGFPVPVVLPDSRPTLEPVTADDFEPLVAQEE